MCPHAYGSAHAYALPQAMSTFTFRTLPPWEETMTRITSTQTRGRRNVTWYRTWMDDISGDLPTERETEWLGEWMAHASPGDVVYINSDDTNKRCDKENADVSVTCDQ